MREMEGNTGRAGNVLMRFGGLHEKGTNGKTQRTTG